MKLTGEDVGSDLFRADTFVLDGQHRFEPSLTLKEDESIEISYKGGKPQAYKVLGPKGEVRQSGKVFSVG